MNTRIDRIRERITKLEDRMRAVEFDCSSHPAEGGAEKHEAANQIPIGSEAFRQACDDTATAIMNEIEGYIKHADHPVVEGWVYSVVQTKLREFMDKLNSMPA